MTAHLRPAAVLILLFTLLLGVAMPLLFVSVAGVAVPFQAGGSLIERDGKVIGSAIIGQNFTSDKYFQPRPSATTNPDPNDATKTVPAPYDASASAASNLAPTDNDIRLHLAKALLKSGDKDAARRELETLAKLDKDSPIRADAEKLLGGL